MFIYTKDRKVGEQQYNLIALISFRNGFYNTDRNLLYVYLVLTPIINSSVKKGWWNWFYLRLNTQFNIWLYYAVSHG